MQAADCKLSFAGPAENSATALHARRMYILSQPRLNHYSGIQHASTQLPPCRDEAAARGSRIGYLYISEVESPRQPDVYSFLNVPSTISWGLPGPSQVVGEGLSGTPKTITSFRPLSYSSGLKGAESSMIFLVQVCPSLCKPDTKLTSAQQV